MALAAVSSTCASSRACGTIVEGTPATDGEYPRANWNELRMLEPINTLVKNDALATIVEGLASVISRARRSRTDLNTPLFLYKIPFL